MVFFNRIGEDFRYRFLKDISVLDIVFIVLLLAALLMTLFSKKIAEKYRDSEESVMRLSVKIKTAGLIITAALALLITQVF